MSWRDELSENVWVEGALRLEYDKSGNYNNNCLLAEEKKENTRDRSVPDGSDKKGSSNFIDLQMFTIIRRSTFFLLQYFSIIFQASNMFFPVCDTCCGKVVGQDGIWQWKCDWWVWYLLALRIRLASMLLPTHSTSVSSLLKLITWCCPFYGKLGLDVLFWQSFFSYKQVAPRICRIALAALCQMTVLKISV